VLSEGKSFKLFTRSKFDSSSMVVVWNQDVGRLGSRVADYLAGQLKGRERNQSRGLFLTKRRYGRRRCSSISGK
jgi:hypothetical protein